QPSPGPGVGLTWLEFDHTAVVFDPLGQVSRILPSVSPIEIGVATARVKGNRLVEIRQSASHVSFELTAYSSCNVSFHKVGLELDGPGCVADGAVQVTSADSDHRPKAERLGSSSI